MEGTVSSDETSVLASCTRNIQTDQRNQKHILTHWHPVRRWKQRRKTSFTSIVPYSWSLAWKLEKKKGKSTKEAKGTHKSSTRMNSEQTQKMKNEKKWTKKNKTNRHGKQGEKKGKTGETVQLLNYQPIPLPSLRNKTNARQKTMKATERKAKPER